MENLSLIITAVAFVILLAYCVYLTTRINSLVTGMEKEKENKEDPGKNIISILEEIQEGSENILNKTKKFPEITDELEKKISMCVQKVGISGVETFSLNEEKADDTAIALLNQHGDGAVISFNKNNIINIKAVEKGQAHNKLSKKEEEAIEGALN